MDKEDPRPPISYWALGSEREYISACRQERRSQHIKPGDRYGRLTVESTGQYVSITGWDANGDAGRLDMYDMRCACGRHITVDGTTLRARRIDRCAECAERRDARRARRLTGSAS